MTKPIELWSGGHGIPKTVAERGRRLEAEGWYGMTVVDSQCLSGDPFVGLAMAAAVTTNLRLATGVSNSGTRHPAVTATSAATVQAESDGRFVLGIGRGDSALAHLGLAPSPPAQFERYVERLQGYLRREDVPFDLEYDAVGGLRSSDSLKLNRGPQATRLRWLRDENPKVPVDIAASGPRVIGIAANLADSLTFAVGVDVDRLKWAIETARAARAALGRADEPFALGTYLPMFVHEDMETAKQMISGGISSYARFSVMHGTVAGPVAENQRESLEAVHRTYDMNSHVRHGSPQSKVLSEEVITAFSIAGPASYCVERIQELRELGLTRFVINGPANGLDPEEAAAGHRRLAKQVLPKLR